MPLAWRLCAVGNFASGLLEVLEVKRSVRPRHNFVSAHLQLFDTLADVGA